LLGLGHDKKLLESLSVALKSDRLLLGVLLCVALIGASAVLYVMVIASGNPLPDTGGPGSGFEASFDRAIGLNPAPRRSFLNAKGLQESLADHQGKVVLVNLWATWCAPCVREMPSLDALQARLGGTDFEVMAISMDSEGLGVAKDFLSHHGIKNLKAYNESSFGLAQDFNAEGIPTSILLNKQGLEIGRVVGPAEWDSPEAVRFISGFLGRATPAKTH